jgi:hypothetical protein
MKFHEFLRRSNHTEAIQIKFHGLQLKNRRKEQRKMLHHVELVQNKEIYDSITGDVMHFKNLIHLSTRIARMVWEDSWKDK